MKLNDRISNALEALLCDIYNDLNITSGDITPEQALLWDNIVESANDLFNQLIEQNKEVD